MPDAHANFAYGTVLTAPSPATSGTSLVLDSGQGARFPTPPFNVTIWPTSVQPVSSNAEVVRCTALATDTLTITRSQESSSARSVGVGDQVAATITTKTLTDIEGDVALRAPLASPTLTGTPTLPTGTIATTQSAADSTTKLATTAFATTADNLKANLASPTFTGTVAMPSTTGFATIDGTESAIFALSAATYAGRSALATDTGVLFQSNGSLWLPTAWARLPAGHITGLANILIASITNQTLALSASGTDTLSAIFIPRGYVVSNIVWRSGTTAATFGSGANGHWYFVIRKQDGALMASSADQTTGAINASTVFTKAIARDSANGAASTWTSPASDYYLVGPNIYVGTGGTPVMPTTSAGAAIAPAGINSLAKIVYTNGQTLMTSGTPATTCSPSQQTTGPFVLVT